MSARLSFPVFFMLEATMSVLYSTSVDFILLRGVDAR